jgi:hypothetical protein
MSAVCIVLAAAVATAYFFRGRQSEPPTRYSASANVSVPSSDPDAENRQSAPSVLLRGQESLAVDPETIATARREAGLPEGGDGLSFSARRNEGGDIITMTVTGPAAEPVASIIGAWMDAYIAARSGIVADDNQNKQDALLSSIETLTSRRQRVESELQLQLTTLPRIVYTFDAEDREGSDATASGALGGSTVVPPIDVPNDTPVDTMLLLYERNALYNHVAQAMAAHAEATITSQDPNPYATVIGIGGVSGSGGKAASSALIPSAAILLVGIALAIALPVVRERLDHSIRDGRGAARSLHAPLLSMIPPRRRARGEYIVLEDPTAERSLAFRSLAATSVATDRLPRAILVTSPRGESHDDVAANFAAALTAIGLRVALIGTSPRHDWFAWPFREPESGAATFAEFLSLAHSGRLNGQVQRKVAFDDLNPNLVVIPPGDADELNLRLDGLPVLLEALREADVDVTVIAGPALLDDSNATIMAWATRSVLWAVEIGRLTEADAAAASTRLELAGVEPFGVAAVATED